MAEDKKTQVGMVGRNVRPTGPQTPVGGGSDTMPAPSSSASGTPVPAGPEGEPPTAPLPKTSYIPEVRDPLLGATVAGRYAVVRKLGEGGMGSVYLATHTILEKQVALKVLHGEFARKPDLVERFMQEAKAASRIRHENVIDISDFGTTPEGLVFFAMELLKGHDLHDEIARARIAGHLLPWSRTKKIFLQICGALAAAHAKGIVHRDLKPENVYLVDFLGDPDFVKLLDFGIAKLTEVASAEEGGRKLTKTGMLFGTPEYMSPEQARGEQVDHRVDIYAMGCILFQLVSGRVPFEADNFMGVLSMHLTEEPPAIAPETFDSIGAPRALADVIDRALVKDRNARYQTMDELAAAVREVSGDPPPADRSQPMRAANVAAPVSTTRARPPTPAPPIGVGDPSAAATASGLPRTREPTGGRTKTEWTGNLTVPEIADERPPVHKGSKMPMVVAALVVVAGGAVAAVVLATRGGGAGGSEVASGSAAAGSATAVAPGSAGSARLEAPPPPPPKLPDMVTITLDSTPHGATVVDLSNQHEIGKTPFHFKLAGSTTPRELRFQLRGFGEETVELVPDRDRDYVQPLQKGAHSAGGTVHVVPDTGQAANAGGSAATGGAVTRPDPGQTTAVTHPDSGQTGQTGQTPDISTKAAPDATPVKPPDTGAKKPPDDDCDDPPCLKRNIPGMTGSSAP